MRIGGPHRYRKIHIVSRSRRAPCSHRQAADQGKVEQQSALLCVLKLLKTVN